MWPGESVKRRGGGWLSCDVGGFRECAVSCVSFLCPHTCEGAFDVLVCDELHAHGAHVKQSAHACDYVSVCASVSGGASAVWLSSLLTWDLT